MILSLVFGLLIQPEAFAIEAPIRTQGVEHAKLIELRPDGKYNITCLDDTMEVKTPAELRAGSVCTQFRSEEKTWILSSGGVNDGMRMCPVTTVSVIGSGTVISSTATFKRPCSEVSGVLTCTGQICQGSVGITAYTFDFTQTGQLTITRDSDGFTGVYR